MQEVLHEVRFLASVLPASHRFSRIGCSGFRAPLESVRPCQKVSGNGLEPIPLSAYRGPGFQT